jgi:hypothetical protein
MTSASLTGLAPIMPHNTDERRYIIQQLKFKVLSRCHTLYNVFPYICQFRICISLILTISKTNLYLGASLTGE